MALPASTSSSFPASSPHGDLDMPPIGFGTARLGSKQTMEKALKTAIVEAKLRHVDCAKVYGNEEAIGRVLNQLLKQGFVKREEVFISTKLWNDDHARVKEACLESLKRLQLQYLDLYLVHWPIAWRKGTCAPDDSVDLTRTWQAMESLVDEGLVKRIGVSNFDISVLQTFIIPHCRILPYCNQIELHPFNSQPQLVNFCQQHQIRVVAWSPLAKGAKSLADNPVLSNIAQTKGISALQVVLRWHIQRGVVPIPRSSSPSHICDNMKALNMELSVNEMNAIDSLNENKRLTFDYVGVFDATPQFYSYMGSFLREVARVIFWFIPNRIEWAYPQSLAPP